MTEAAGPVKAAFGGLTNDHELKQYGMYGFTVSYGISCRATIGGHQKTWVKNPLLMEQCLSKSCL